MIQLSGLLSGGPHTIVECGSADGETTEILLDVAGPGSKIYCFEPDPRGRARFESRVSLQSRRDQWELIPAALSNTNGEAPFHLSSGHLKGREDEHIFSSLLRKPTGCLKQWPDLVFEETITVDTVRLDTWFAENQIDLVPSYGHNIHFIWADVQGAERELIAGGQETLKHAKYFYTEYGEGLYGGQAGLHEIEHSLPAGYTWHAIFPTDALFVNKAGAGVE